MSMSDENGCDLEIKMMWSWNKHWSLTCSWPPSQTWMLPLNQTSTIGSLRSLLDVSHWSHFPQSNLHFKRAEASPCVCHGLARPHQVHQTCLFCVCVCGVVWWRAVIQKWSAWIHIGGQEFPTTKNSQTGSLYLINPCRTVLLHSRCPAFRQLLVCRAKSFDDYLMTSKAGGVYCDQTQAGWQSSGSAC